VNELVNCVEEGREYPPAESMHSTVFAEMDKMWKEVDYDKKDAKPFDGTMVGAVRLISRRLRQSEAYKRIMDRVEADAAR
jgi:hypothetical protein